jgi:predicted helicase
MPDQRDALRNIHTFPQLIKFLRDELDWPIKSDDFEELTFDYTPEELGIDTASAAKIQEIKRLRPLSASQPWGIFFVKFEPKRLPVVALRRMLSRIVLKKRASANSADRAAWQADDLLFVSNYGEGTERQISFAHFSQNADKADLPTLKVLGWDNRDTVLHLDEVATLLHQRLVWPRDERDTNRWRELWRSAFTLRHREVITTSKDLATRLAELARDIRIRIQTVLAIETEKGPLTKLMKAFQQALIHDLNPDDFADMYAQTIAYGLLSARVANPAHDTADAVATHIPVTNPFLKELMETFLQLGGRKRKDRGGEGIDFDELGVSEVVELLDSANMEAVVRDFGDHNPDEDPVIHFYELFLKEYDAKKRMQRGVFYTPQPVVSYIVRSVHELLQTEFGLEDGLASTVTWSTMAAKNANLKIPDGVNSADPFVVVLDPATGTATFLVEVIEIIYRTLRAKWKQQNLPEAQIRDAWNDYVPKNLLPRLHGYELLMAPYAIAHMKVGLKLYETGYRFGSDERARIYLTNSLEPPSDDKKQREFEEWVPALAHEAKAVNAIKRNQRFTVVVGNPPYSKSMSKNPWSLGLVEGFKAGLNEKKSDLTREEWKFLSFGYYNIEAASVGIIGLVINNAFLSAPTHRGIRQFLLRHSSTLRIFDLHGDSRKGEASPDGTLDQNVFEIQQGVCIILSDKNGVENSTEQIGKANIFGSQQYKYERLSLSCAASTVFDRFSPHPLLFFFRRSKSDEASPYDLWTPISEMFVNSNTGIQTKNDELFTDISSRALSHRMSDVLGNLADHRASVCMRYGLADSAGWRVSQLNGIPFDNAAVHKFLYKPFDHRFIYYNVKALGRARYSTMQHMLKPNLALVATRQITRLPFCHAFVSRWPIEEKTGSHDRTTQLLPLYIYPETGQFDFSKHENGRRSAFSPSFTARASEMLGATIKDIEIHPGRQLISSEQLFDYIYSILYSPSYREQFGPQLMGDFPRIPLTENLELFHLLAILGGELISLHLLESPKLEDLSSSYVGSTSAEVEKICHARDTVWLDKAQTKGFIGVSEAVWEFHIGGYQVCEKWLKDRKGRTLSRDDMAHYQKIVIALSETIRLMTEIDKVIEAHGGWPDAFTISQD